MMCRHIFFRDSESESHAAVVPVSRFIRPIKSVENERDMFGGYTLSGVCDLNLHKMRGGTVWGGSYHPNRKFGFINDEESEYSAII